MNYVLPQKHEVLIYHNLLRVSGSHVNLWMHLQTAQVIKGPQNSFIENLSSFFGGLFCECFPEAFSDPRFLYQQWELEMLRTPGNLWLGKKMMGLGDCF